VYDQFSIQGGNWQPEPWQIRLAPEGTVKGERGRGDLLMVIEAPRNRPLSRDVCDGLIQVLIDNYYQTPGSITRALREAVLAANAWLFEQNLRLDTVRRVLVGLNCAAVRPEEAFLAQLGPGVAYLVRAGAAQRFPSDSVWLRSQPPGMIEINREPPAGLRRDVEPSLFRASLDPGDVLLLATTDLAHMGGDSEIAGAVVGAGRGAPRDSLEALASGRDVSVLIAQRPEDAVAPSSEVTLPKRAASPMTEGVPSKRAGSPGEFQPSAPVGEAPALTPGATAPEAGQVPATPLPTKGGRRIQLPPQTGRTATMLHNGEDVAPQDQDGHDGVVAEDIRRSSPRRGRKPAVDVEAMRDTLGEGAQRLRQGTEDILLHMLPSEIPERPAERRSSGDSLPLTGKALVSVALVIPLMVLFTVVMTRIQYERVNRERLTAVQQKATARCDAAAKLQDAALRRQSLSDCLAAIEEGLSVIPDDATLIDLRNRTLHRLDTVDGVERLYYFTRLIALENEPLTGSEPTRLIVVGKDVLLLNRSSDRLFKFLLNDIGDALQSVEANPILLQRDELREGSPVGELVDVAWLGAAGDRTLGAFAALGRTGSLYVYDSLRGIRVAPVANSDLWLKPAAMGAYAGNLYVLDPLLGRILKYMPTNNAYTTPPNDYLAPNQDVDLTGAVDMAIDGNVYVLYADGRVAKYFNGQGQPFTMQGLPSAMRGPTSIHVSGPREPQGQGYVYVVDAGNERIVQFDKQGAYLRQFQARADEPYFRQIRGIYVDEAESRMFVYSGNTLWLTSVPKVQGR
jgi:sugar lactone lactonase YvrE